MARMHTFHLHACLKAYLRLYSPTPGFSAKTGLPGKRVKLDKPALRELLFWVNLPLADCQCSLLTPAGFSYLYTDASSRLWGATLLRQGHQTNVTGFFPASV